MGEFYVTTPIYYVNDVPHIGHAYTTIAADVLARYHRLRGDSVFFLTGTDEHGAKIAEAAREHGKGPKVYADEMVAQFKAAWKHLDISNDYFVRTTDPRHERAVQKFIAVLHERGDIYRARYEGLYCVGCERFVTEDDLVEGKCPLHLREPVLYAEDNYFFRLSKYQDMLARAITDPADPNHFEVSPPARRNEVLGKLRVGLSDISISRATLTWGIPLPFDPSQTTYVWVDALLNYITAIGYEDDPASLARWWPADLQLMAKDILWFHAIIWPAMLLSAGLRPPRHVFAHGFFTIEGQKISKTLGNIIRPHQLIERYGVDATRYLMLGEFPFGVDGDISLSSFTARYNADLANDLGNLLNRVVSMINRYFGGRVPAPDSDHVGELDRDLQTVAERALVSFDASLEAVAFGEGLSAIWQLLSRANKYVEECAPWALAKSDRARLAVVLYNLAESLRLVAEALWPVMPEATARVARALGISLDLTGDWARITKWGGLPIGAQVEANPTPLFPRIL